MIMLTSIILSNVNNNIIILNRSNVNNFYIINVTVIAKDRLKLILGLLITSQNN